MSYFRVVRPYTARQPGELSLAVGDVIGHTENLGNGWTVGCDVSNGAVGGDAGTGAFPTACVAALLVPEVPPRGAVVVADGSRADRTTINQAERSPDRRPTGSACGSGVAPAFRRLPPTSVDVELLLSGGRRELGGSDEVPAVGINLNVSNTAAAGFSSAFQPPFAVEASAVIPPFCSPRKRPTLTIDDKVEGRSSGLLASLEQRQQQRQQPTVATSTFWIGNKAVTRPRQTDVYGDPTAPIVGMSDAREATTPMISLHLDNSSSTFVKQKLTTSGVHDNNNYYGRTIDSTAADDEGRRNITTSKRNVSSYPSRCRSSSSCPNFRLLSSVKSGSSGRTAADSNGNVFDARKRKAARNVASVAPTGNPNAMSSFGKALPAAATSCQRPENSYCDCIPLDVERRCGEPEFEFVDVHTSGVLCSTENCVNDELDLLGRRRLVPGVGRSYGTLPDVAAAAAEGPVAGRRRVVVVPRSRLSFSVMAVSGSQQLDAVEGRATSKPTELTRLRSGLAGVCRPIVTSRHHKVSDSHGESSTAYAQDQIVVQSPAAAAGECKTTSRWLLSFVVGLLFGVVVLLYGSCRLQLSLVVSLSVSAASTVLVCAGCALSRTVRCSGALLLPSASLAASGRLGVLLIVSALVVGGPVSNVCVNVRTASAGLACGVELGRNQTALMSSSMDALTARLTSTVSGLQRSARTAWRELRPLDDGLARLNGALYNGAMQLYGARKTCRTYVERAFGACVLSIEKARTQCLGVMDALGDVYSHARDVLDRLNPDRWAPRLPPAPNSGVLPLKQHTHHNKLQPDHSSNVNEVTSWDDLMSDERDICEPLHALVVCQPLNASDALCSPSGWAGDVIRRALNRTQLALGSLFDALELRLKQSADRVVADRAGTAGRTGASDDTRSSSSSGYKNKTWGPVRERVSVQVGTLLDFVEASVAVLGILLPVLAIVLVSRAAHITLQDHIYGSSSDYVRFVDHLLLSGDGGGRSPSVGGGKVQRRTRKVFGSGSADSGAIDAGGFASSSGQIDGTEAAAAAEVLRRKIELRSLAGDGLLIVILHAAFSASCYAFDVSLHWVLTLVNRHATPPFDFTGARSVGSVAAGDGTIVALLAEFLTGLHAGHWFGFGGGESGSGYACSVLPSSPDLVGLSIVVVVYGFLLSSMAIRSRVYDWRNRILARFYPEEERRKTECYLQMTTYNRGLNAAFQPVGSEHRRRSPLSPNETAFMRDLMCVGACPPSNDCELGSYSTLLAVRRAPPPPPPPPPRLPPPPNAPRCVACGQAVSRRRRRSGMVEGMTTAADLVDGDVCPVCDCQLMVGEVENFSGYASCSRQQTLS